MRQRSGFTLVELSIVLVIIGLLIGGILAAQSMVNTAKITATVRQIGQFDAGVSNFKERFQYLPGDAPAFGGNGNNVIGRYVQFGGDAVNYFQGELVTFWNNAFPNEYVIGDVNGCPKVISGPNKNVPEAKIGSPGSYFLAVGAANLDFATYADLANPMNFYAILNSLQAQGPWFAPSDATNSAVRPADALALDSKMDDGSANTGFIISGSFHNSPNPGLIFDPVAGICSSGATYMTDHSGYECTPLIRIGGSVGNPQ